MSSIWINLCVGQKTFSTTSNTLNKIPYFQDLIKSPSFLSQDLFKIDSDESVFKHVLRWAQNPLYVIPIKYHWGLDFWGIRLDKLPSAFDLTPCQTTIDKIDKELVNFHSWVCFKRELTPSSNSLQISVPIYPFHKLTFWKLIFPKDFHDIKSLLEFDIVINNNIIMSGAFDNSCFIIINEDECLVFDLAYTLWKIPEYKINEHVSQFEIAIRLKKNSQKSVELSGKGYFGYELIESNSTISYTHSKTLCVKCLDGHIDTLKLPEFSIEHINTSQKVFVFATTEKVDLIRFQKFKQFGTKNKVTLDFRTKTNEEYQYELRFDEITPNDRYVFDIYPSPKECWFYFMDGNEI